MSKSKLTRKLIEGAIEANFTEFFVKFIHHNLYDWEIPDGYDVEDYYGNSIFSEDEGSQKTKIIHLKGFDLYVAVDGIYDSYDETDWYNCYLVKPTEVKVTKFQKA